MAEFELIRDDVSVIEGIDDVSFSEESETSSCQEDQSVVRKEGLKILKEIQINKEELGNIEYQGLPLYMDDTELWYTKVKSVQTMVVDARIVKTLCVITKKQAESVSANIIKFTATVRYIGQVTFIILLSFHHIQSVLGLRQATGWQDV